MRILKHGKQRTTRYQLVWEIDQLFCHSDCLVIQELMIYMVFLRTTDDDDKFLVSQPFCKKTGNQEDGKMPVSFGQA